ncbi:hypothetical protein BJ970_007116 [Saccharopolyspora phatthalungensis]|uniref:Uncharacterized protein n=1 Tax=Saccharopolyspora phatthalungensis TaxID=664693 RepID=A0A840QH89_9PSEU|nr:hypothetical protein [Saccharopolyspora phatthalungensis]
MRRTPTAQGVLAIRAMPVRSVRPTGGRYVGVQDRADGRRACPAPESRSQRCRREERGRRSTRIVPGRPDTGCGPAPSHHRRWQEPGEKNAASGIVSPPVSPVCPMSCTSGQRAPVDRTVEDGAQCEPMVYAMGSRRAFANESLRELHDVSLSSEPLNCQDRAPLTALGQNLGGSGLLTWQSTGGGHGKPEQGRCTNAAPTLLARSQPAQIDMGGQIGDVRPDATSLGTAARAMGADARATFPCPGNRRSAASIAPTVPSFP